MSENPYQLVRDIRGIGFRTADLIAEKLGIEKTAIIRVRAGIGEIDDYSPKITGRSWDDFKRLIFASFPEFEQYLASGVGLRLQRKDSDLAE